MFYIMYECTRRTCCTQCIWEKICIGKCERPYIILMENSFNIKVFANVYEQVSNSKYQMLMKLSCKCL